MKLGKHFERLAAAVASGSTVRAAAVELGIGESTAYRTSSDPRFAGRVAALRTAASDAAVGGLTAAAVDAVSVLRAIALDTEAKHGDRIAAAKAILTALGPLSETHELRQRLDKLEAANNLRIVQ